MKNSTRLVVMLVLFALVALPAAAGKKQPPPSNPPTADVRFCSNDIYQGPVCDPTNNAFDVNTTRDITIFVAWQNVVGAHVQKLVFIMPNGDPYQAMSTSFDTTTGQGLQTINPPTVSNVLPISGTWIQQRAITGAWTVQVFLDDVLITQATLNLY